MRRAAHQILDTPKVLDDPLATRILGDAQPWLGQDPFSRSMRAFMAVRSRYAEDQLAAAVADGVRQYVVLGAGLDTFAYRNPFSHVEVFEVDHPATQAWKRDRLNAAGIGLAGRLVPVDFETQALDSELCGAGFDTAKAAFFSWLGVVPYLTREAFEGTLRFIAAMPAGSGVAFDFAIDRACLSFMERMALDALARRVAAAGEPFQLFFHPQALDAELERIGLSRVERLDQGQINARYFAGREDGLHIRGGLGQLATAWV